MAVADGAGGLWVASVAPPVPVHGRVHVHGPLLRLDPATGKQIARIPVGWWPSAVAVGAGGVWVADSLGDGSRLKDHLPGLENALTRVDPRTNRVVATIRIPVIESVAASSRSVWVESGLSGVQTISSVDPATNHVTARLTLHGVPGPLVYGGGRLWALTWQSSPSLHARVREIDPRSDRVVDSFTVPRAGPLSALAYRNGALWVTAVNQASGSLRGRIIRIRLDGGGRLDRPELATAASGLAAAGSGVWAAAGRSLVLLDPASGRVSSRLHLPAGAPLGEPQSLVAAAGQVWVLSGAQLLAVRATP